MKEIRDWGEMLLTQRSKQQQNDAYEDVETASSRTHMHTTHTNTHTYSTTQRLLVNKALRKKNWLTNIAQTKKNNQQYIQIVKQIHRHTKWRVFILLHINTCKPAFHFYTTAHLKMNAITCMQTLLCFLILHIFLFNCLLNFSKCKSEI